MRRFRGVFAASAGVPLSGTAAPRSVRDFIISPTKELNKTESVTEWIGHARDVTPS